MNHTGQYTTTLTPVIELHNSTIPWQRLWEIVRNELTRHGFATSTISMYETVLRNFATDQRGKPRRITKSAVQAYIWDLADKHSSWSWIASNICVLRTVFDKLGGMRIATSLVTPKRPIRLPEILNSSEIHSLFKSAIRPRDRLLLALLYGCGLRTSEACNLKWKDIDTDKKIINIPASYHVKARQLALPEELCAIFIAGKQLNTHSPYVFIGNNANHPLCTRTLQQVIREIARKAGIGKPVTAMTLRHTYAVHLLEMGANIRELQEQLGHTQIDTTLIYQKCFLPKNARSPLDTLKNPSSSSLPIHVHPCCSSVVKPLPSHNQSTLGPHQLVSPKLPGEGGSAISNSPPLPPLFDESPENPGIDFTLTFNETPLEKAYAFYERLKSRITSRLLMTG